MRKCRPRQLGGLLTVAMFACLSDQANAAYNQSLTQMVTTAHNTRSPIKGEIDPADGTTQRFLGIPFAAPPVGALRWHAPADPAAWSDPLIATQFRSACAQVSGLFDPAADPARFGTVTGSEDCLYLNVFRPNTNQSNLPVFYWVPGGANLYGGANDPVYEGANFAARNNVIVVTVNYRLAMLGFLYESALHTRGNTKLDNSGNFATLDLVKGLNWVADNIQTFGGDRQNITIGGQSAGCIDVWGLIQTPLAAGKFQKAICMSGIPNTYSTHLGQGFAHDLEDRILMRQNPKLTLDQAKKRRMSMSGSAIASLLYAASAEEIVKDTPQPVNPGHFIDGTVIPSFLGVPGLLECTYNNVPMVIGSVRTEGSLFVGLGAGWQVDQKTMWRMINGTAPASNAAILKPSWGPAPGMSFSSSGYAKTSKTLSDLVVFLTDQIERYLQVQHLKPFGLCFPSAVYRYQFEWQNVPQPWQDIYGTEHAVDVPFVFGNFTRPSFLAYAYTSANELDRHDLSKLLNSYLGNFLWNSDPNDARNNPNPYSWAPKWNAWTDIVGVNKRLIFNASLGKADAGSISHMSANEELAATTDILSLPPAGYQYSEVFLKSFIPQEWLTELGQVVP